ncbi:MAG: hypothetical protein AAF388_00225 [Bacteroidota bacterium]
MSINIKARPGLLINPNGTSKMTRQLMVINTTKNIKDPAPKPYK